MGRNNHEDNYKANNAVTDQLISGITDTQKETDASNDGEEAIINVVTPKTAASMMAHPCKTKNLISIPVDYVSLEVEQHTLIEQSRGVARESLNAHMGKSWKRIAHDPHFSTHAPSIDFEAMGPKRLFQETITERMTAWWMGSARAKNGARVRRTTMTMTLQWRRLITSPAEPNEDPKLEMPWAWEPNGS